MLPQRRKSGNQKPATKQKMLLGSGASPARKKEEKQKKCQNICKKTLQFSHNCCEVLRRPRGRPPSHGFGRGPRDPPSLCEDRPEIAVPRPISACPTWKNPRVVGTNEGRSQGHILTYVALFLCFCGRPACGAPSKKQKTKKKNDICQNMSLAPPPICAHHMWVFPTNEVV